MGLEGRSGLSGKKLQEEKGGTSGLESQKSVSTSGQQRPLGLLESCFSCINLAFNEQFPLHQQGGGEVAQEGGKVGLEPCGRSGPAGIFFLRGSHTTAERDINSQCVPSWHP